MGVADGRGEVLDLRREGLPGCDGTAQDRVDQTPHRTAGAGHRFVDGGVVRDAEDEELADSHPQDIAGLVV